MVEKAKETGEVDSAEDVKHHKEMIRNNDTIKTFRGCIKFFKKNKLYDVDRYSKKLSDFEANSLNLIRNASKFQVMTQDEKKLFTLEQAIFVS